MARRRRTRRDGDSLIGLAALVLIGAGIAADDPSRWSIELPQADAPASEDRLRVASFNVKFVGYYPERDDDALAAVLSAYDVVLLQEIVAPPYPGTFPDGAPFRPDPETTEFFEAMRAHGFAYALSPEDTGRGPKNHNNGASTEWFAAFYRPERVRPAGDLPHGYLADDRTAHRDFDRVPHAFAFRPTAGGPDFVLISVHLHADAGGWKRRRHELETIARWVGSHEGAERDFIVVGDMNVQDCDELERVIPRGYASLNHDCRSTNTVSARSQRKGRPYDHVLLRLEHAAEVDLEEGMRVLDLVDAMSPYWHGPAAYPGVPYRHREFIQHYSDHHPVTFAIRLDVTDDDGDQAVLAAGDSRSLPGAEH